MNKELSTSAAASRSASAQPKFQCRDAALRMSQGSAATGQEMAPFRAPARPKGIARPPDCWQKMVQSSLEIHVYADDPKPQPPAVAVSGCLHAYHFGHFGWFHPYISGAIISIWLTQ